MYTIKNDFHRTEARTRGGRLSEATERRLKRELCGIAGCTCGGICGERGEQECEITYDAQNRVYVTDLEMEEWKAYWRRINPQRSLTCPVCHQVHVDTEGHTDGPREFHAACWLGLSDSQQQYYLVQGELKS